MTDRRAALILAALLAIGVLMRLVVAIGVRPEITADGIAYMTMAQNLAEQGILRDSLGLRVFYSAGYPLLLTPAFALFGPGLATVILVNCALVIATGLLLHRLMRMLVPSRRIALLAVAGWMLWLPAIWDAAMPAKENLATFLVVALAIAAVALTRRGATLLPALIAGLAWGAGTVTGGSAILAAFAMLAALIILIRRHQPVFAAKAALAFALGGLLTLGPWLAASHHMVGEPILTSNAEFNLYLGNNPAATGEFVSIADTPVGPRWQAESHRLGETRSAHWLGDLARSWIAEHPEDALHLALVKLRLFWTPNVPDAADFAASAAISLVRLADVAMYVVVLVAALVGLWRAHMSVGDRWILGALIFGFWIVHAAAYIIPRYRDPIAPLLVAMAACLLWSRLPRKEKHGG